MVYGLKYRRTKTAVSENSATLATFWLLAEDCSRSGDDAALFELREADAG